MALIQERNDKMKIFGEMARLTYGDRCLYLLPNFSAELVPKPRSGSQTGLCLLAIDSIDSFCICGYCRVLEGIKAQLLLVQKSNTTSSSQPIYNALNQLHHSYRRCSSNRFSMQTLHIIHLSQRRNLLWLSRRL